MKICHIGVVLVVGLFASHVCIGEQPQLERPSIESFGSTQDSGALQAIRSRVVESCNRNPDCAKRAASGPNDTRSLHLQTLPGEAPSTPERRRALGLTVDPVNQR
jgi:hypothetical protein